MRCVWPVKWLDLRTGCVFLPSRKSVSPFVENDLTVSSKSSCALRIIPFQARIITYIFRYIYIIFIFVHALIFNLLGVYSELCGVSPHSLLEQQV